MISTGRCYGGGRAADRRIVNGTGNSAVSYVNRCEQALDAKNEMVVATSQVACNDHNGFEKAFSAYTSSNLRLIETLGAQCGTLKKLLCEKNETIKQMAKEVQLKNQNLNKFHQQLAEAHDKIKQLENLAQNPLTCSSSVSKANTVELPEQQSIVPNKKRKILSLVVKESDSHPPEPDQAKKPKSRSTRNKSCDSSKLQELSLVTVENPYYTCLGDYNAEKDDSVPVKKNSNLEIPSWRIKQFTSWYSMEGTEDMSDDIFENRHAKFEANERKRKRWDLQRLRELKRNEYLKERRNKSRSQDDKKEELTSLLPNPACIKAFEITNNLPLSIFGDNLYIKKDSASFKFYHNKFCHDGSRMPQESNVRGLRSSGRNPLLDYYLEN